MERGSNVLNFLSRFMHEFQSKMANTRRAPTLHVRAGLLRLRPEDRVPTSDVGEYGMRTSLRIFESHPMLFAGPTAIAVRRAGGKEAAEHAMLGVEDGQMLIRDGFQTLWADGPGQSGDLLGVEIVRRGEALHTQLQIRFGRERVGGIEAEIADQ